MLGREVFCHLYCSSYSWINAKDIGPGTYGEETMMYADDVAVIANSITDIQEAANRLWLEMKANGMKVNTRKGKTKLVVVSKIS